MNGIERIAAERQRQIDREGYGTEHDNEHYSGEIALAAAVYAIPLQARIDTDAVEWLWPVGWEYKPKDALHDLVKAGALIAAEIDRLLRAGAR